MRSLKRYKNIENIFKLKPGCFYKMKTTDDSTWLFEFIEYRDGYHGEPIVIVSGETYNVSSDHYFNEISTLCSIREILEETVVKISLNEFNNLRGV